MLNERPVVAGAGDEEDEGLDPADLWRSREVRRAALRNVVVTWGKWASWVNDPKALPPASLLAPIDLAVAEWLASQDLPRQANVTVRLSWESRAMDYVVYRDDHAEILVKPSYLVAMLQHDLPDAVYHAWIHESLHARKARETHPWSLAEAALYERCPGYEEGPAEALARILADKIGLNAHPTEYDYFAAAWEALASALEVEPEKLLRWFHSNPLGAAQAGLFRTVDLARCQAGIHPLDSQGQRRLDAQAEAFFADANRGRRVGPGDRRALETAWREALAPRARSLFAVQQR